MKELTRRLKSLGWSLAMLPLAASLAYAGAQGGAQASALPFQYAGGTEKIEQDSPGILKVTSEGLIFWSTNGTVNLPFSTITIMEYRPNLSRRVRELKVKWSVTPDTGGHGRNRYFTVVCKDKDTTRVVVLNVDPRALRPYLAEIELKSGKRVDVFEHVDYE